MERMNTQNTPVHIRLWHKGFWQMAVANLLLTMSVYIQIPVLPLWMTKTAATVTPLQVGICMGVFGFGVFALGPFCSYLVQRYRRNVVCMWAIGAIALCLAFLYMDGHTRVVDVGSITLFRFLLGAGYGLAQMVLSSTLIIDTSESFQRTEANHNAAWFSRFSLSLGPMTGLLFYNVYGLSGVMVASGVCALVSIILIRMVDFPFRAPEENVKVCSLDRFLLPNGKWLFVNLMLITMVIGMVMALPLTNIFYAMMMIGFLLALLAQRFVFPGAELESEVVSGLILIGAALLAMLVREQAIVSYLSPLLIGIGTGLIGSRFLLFFIKLSRHCQRGTSQSMFFLAWELGLSLGIMTGIVMGQTQLLLAVALCITVVALTMYHLFTHKWFVCHKNR